MTLRRVPGFRNYQAEDEGFQSIGLSPQMARHMKAVGDGLAGDAQAVGDSTYDAELTTVRMGWMNKPRAAVDVSESNRDWRDSRDRILLRVVEAKASAKRS